MTTSPDPAAMRLAIEASRMAVAAGDRPYGAALAAPDGEVLLVERNRQHTANDSTAHAEMVLVREAEARLGAASLQGATVYASGEPCAMCAGAMFWAGVARVVYAAPQPALALMQGGPLLPARCADLLGHAQPPVRVEGEFLADEALAVLRETSTTPPRDSP
ncbi:nucleoside deaminase [Ottowia sp. GY511]|uniref:Nucleoside deaminase n=1 Tax=Ottowia flava TaxID=2675430 RepID=A0ABW4KWU0_9BURK|nr:nucleoside deaminase [Ottowia sp. GY511]TXK31343.1 nucleoside deaminase [Ottowia sp. GY511]